MVEADDLINFDVRTCRRRAKDLEKWQKNIVCGQAQSRAVELMIMVMMVVV
jgi:hypothetical protein